MGTPRDRTLLGPGAGKKRPPVLIHRSSSPSKRDQIRPADRRHALTVRKTQTTNGEGGTQHLSLRSCPLAAFGAFLEGTVFRVDFAEIKFGPGSSG
jgi:hypothetical protein